MSLSDREELAKVINKSFYRMQAGDTFGYQPTFNEGDAQLAGDVWAAGWRKKPSREAIARSLYVADHWGIKDAGGRWDEGFPFPWEVNACFRSADAILALLDGPTENGEKP